MNAQAIFVLGYAVGMFVMYVFTCRQSKATKTVATPVPRGPLVADTVGFYALEVLVGSRWITITVHPNGLFLTADENVHVRLRKLTGYDAPAPLT